MPFMKKVNGKSVRDYAREKKWDHTHDGGKRIKDRAERNKARATVAKAKGVKPTAIKGDVDHRKPISRGGKSTLANLFVTAPSKNRSFARNANGSLKSQTSKRERKGKI